MDVSYTHCCQKDEINWNWNWKSAAQTGTLWQALTTHYSITYQPVPTCSTDSTLSTPKNSTAPALKGSTVISIKLNGMNCMNLPHSFHPWFMPLTTGRTHTVNTRRSCSMHIVAVADAPLRPLTPCVCHISWAHPGNSAVMITVVMLFTTHAPKMRFS
jgi:hypothetical protein